MISEKSLSKVCRPAVLGRGRIIAQRSDRIWNRTCSYSGSRTSIVACVDSSSGYEDHYRCGITIDEAADEVVDYHCTCPAARRYPGPCKHSIALALDFNRNAGAYKGHSPQNQTSTSRVLGDYLDRACAPAPVRVASAADATPGTVGLKVTLEHEYDWYLRLRIAGPRGSYVVRDVGELAQDIMAGAFHEYGKKLAFVHSLDMFDAQSRPVAELLVRAVQNRRSFASSRVAPRVFGMPGLQTPIGRELRLSPPELDELLALHVGRTLEVEVVSEGVQQPARDVTVADGDPQVGLRIKEASHGAFDLEREGEAEFFTTPGHLYALTRDALFRCTKRLLDVAPFLTSVYSSHAARVLLGERDVPRFAAAVLPRVGEAMHVDAPQEVLDQMPQPLRLDFYLDHARQGVTCRAEASYGARRLSVLTRDPDAVPDYARDAAGEARARQLVQQYFRLPAAGGTVATIGEKDTPAIARLLLDGMARLREAGTVHATEAFDRMLRREAPKVQVGLSVRSNLINLRVSADDLPLDELFGLLASYRRHQRFHRLRDGSFVDLAGADLSQAATLADELGLTARDLAAGEVSIPSYKAFLLDNIMTDEQKDESFRAYVDGFRSVDHKRFEPPASVAAQLRPYQRAGFQWLSALAAMGFGGILADEMGLGKSVQMISFLLANRGRGTSLVVCPSSLVYNWVAEFQKFAPQMDVVPVVGTAPERARIRREPGHEVLVTSYDLLRRDIEAYAPMDFWCEVLDEAQYIKNHETLSARAVKAVTARHRFALTGTPIENRLSELWSIFDYLMPGLLGGYDRFRERYEDPILAGDADCANRLRAAIGPFVLRRLKRDVLSDLPDKLEQVVYAQLSGEQRQLYNAHEQALRLSLASQSDQEFTRGKLQVLAELMRLRQLCCDPRLVYDGYDGPSAKLDTIFSLVERVVDAQAKVLVFSQFTSYLDLIAQRLDASGIAHFVLTGSTPKRRRIQLVDAFNQDDTPVFLISLKAGGTGLNLTGASVVVHADPWWNAAAQNQATDRAHRIGQTREVTVYKVIARDTVEDRILALQEAKSELANQVVGEGGGASLSSLRKEDLVDLLGQ